ncbi:MAG: hypothetical protein WC521_04970 [Bdellovibrionales bacterium]|jgi:deoxycytidylate deaminase
MFSKANSSDVPTAQRRVEFILKDIYDYHFLLSLQKSKFRAIEFKKQAKDANTVEALYSKRIFKAAKEITVLSGKGWEKNKNILRLWRQVAEAVLLFSEHPDKKVAALIISDKGELLAFSANRMLKGVPKNNKYFTLHDRRKRIPCAEKLATANMLEVSTKHRQVSGLSDADRLSYVEDEVLELNEKVIAKGQKDKRFKNCFILTTAPSCMSCAEMIVELNFKGVIAPAKADKHFRCEDEMVIARKFMKKRGIQIHYLPKAVLAR